MKFRFCGDLDCPNWILAEVTTLSKLTAVRIKLIVTQVLSNCIEGTFNHERILKLAATHGDGVRDIKGAIAAIHFILTNSARFDLDESSMSQEVLQLGLPKESVDTLCRQYREYKDSLRNVLAQESYRVSRLLDTEWRVDHIIATSSSTTDSSAGTDDNDGDNNGKESVSYSQSSVVHLKVKLDTKPHERVLESADLEMNGINSNRIQETAFEMNPQDIDLLLHELTSASNVMASVD